jgi:CheY-like chemotaxis protein
MTQTVLLIEDDARVLMLASRMLTSLGFVVLAASSEAEAAALQTAHGKPVDLILCDMILPGRNGQAAATALTSANPGAKVLFMSGHTPRSLVRNGLLGDTQQFIQKPFGIGELAGKVWEVLGA